MAETSHRLSHIGLLSFVHDKPLSQHLLEILWLDGLGDVVIHASLDTSGPILDEGVGCHRDDDRLVDVCPFPDLSGCL